MKMRTDEILDFINEHHIHFVKLMFCDVYGTLKNIIITKEELHKAFKYGISFDGSSVKGFVNANQSDLLLMPDLSTAMMITHNPYEETMVGFYCDVMYPNYTPFCHDGRFVLKQAVEKCKKMGYEAQIGTECEFYLFECDEKGCPTYNPIDRGTYLDVYPLDKGEKIRREICMRMNEVGLIPETSHHENGPGQNEIDFKYSDPLSAADGFLVFKNIVDTIAAMNGVAASFLPKPLKNESGNGLHINISLKKDGQNIFMKDNPCHKEAQHFIAGVLNRTPDMMSLLCSREMSYDRLGSHLAPKYVGWSYENRSQLIRIPAAMDQYARMELRVGDPLMNPYFVFALVLHAGLKGIENEEELMNPVEEDVLKSGYGDLLKPLPHSLKEALELMKKSDFILDVLGEDWIKKYYILTL